ncbi:MAG: hypothetical protein ACPG4Z_00840 [Chitinophagales bacterium]
MIKTKFYADLHLHPTLKSSNWGLKKKKKNPWETFEHIKPETPAGRYAMRASMDLAKYTQANFEKLMQGKVKIAFLSLYPFERGFFNVRNVPNLLTSKKAKVEMVAVSSGMGREKTEYYFNHTDYFKELNDEYNFIKENQGKSPCGKYSYKIATSYNDIKESLAKENELSIVLTAEGAHALFDEKMLSGKLDKAALKKRLVENIGQMKSWEHPMSFITLMHHFYNGLGGHAKSLTEIGNSLLNQRKGLERPIEGLGLSAMKELLSNTNGRRVLIDSKHMSLQVRKDYYKWIRTYNYINKHDNIPIICSHGGVNGYKTMSGSLKKKDTIAKKNKHYFFNWAINLSDEEMKIIHETKGLMGLIIDKGKLAGGQILKKIEKESNKAIVKEMYMKQIWDNLFQGVEAIGSKSAWNIFSLGTDYDGAINHVEFYDDATKLPTLYGDLYEYLDRTQYRKKLWHGYRPDEILHKVFQTNAIDFLAQNFK